MLTSIGSILLIAGLCPGTKTADGDEIRVPAEFASIQEAVSEAEDGDLILVAEGVYPENVDFLGKDLHLLSQFGPDKTVIDGQDLGPVVQMISGEGPGAILEGFTIRNGHNIGVRVEDASPVIRRNVIENNSGIFPTSVRGVLLQDGAPVVEGNVVRNNAGVGISTTGLSSAVIRGNEIYGNLSEGLLVRGAPAVIGNEVHDNDRAGIGCIAGAALVQDNHVHDNERGGIRVQVAGNVQIIGNLVENNQGIFGGGIRLNGAGTPVVRGNVVRGNTATSFEAGGGIGLSNFSDAVIECNLVIGNTSSGGGIAWLVPAGRRGPIVRFNTIVGNDGVLASGIYAEGFDDETVVYGNVIVALPGQTAVFCSSEFDPTPPIFRHNDVFSVGGLAFDGACDDLTGIDGNISADPLFVDDAAGDYELGVDSPCIDAGDPNELPLTLDLAGSLRLLDGDLDGAMVVDLGAYEYSHVRLAVEGIPRPGNRLDLKVSGTAGLTGFVVIGTAPGTTLLAPFGTLFHGPGGFTDMLGPFGSPPLNAQVQIPIELMTPFVLNLQALGLQRSSGAGNLSNPVQLLIEPLLATRPGPP